MVLNLIDPRSQKTEFIAEVNAAWSDALTLAKFRNRIAHSPLVLVWRGREAEGEPDFLAIPDFRSASGDRMQYIATIDQAELGSRTDDAHRLAVRLHDLLEQMS
jgi:hypothetical protein